MMAMFEDLLAAIQDCRADRLKILGPAVDWSDPEIEKIRPLHYAAQIADWETVQALLSTQCKRFINSFDDIAYNPLMHAAKRGDAKMVAILLEAGANVNANDESQIGNTALREVIETADRDLVAQLLRAGADPTIKGWMQLNAVDKAKERYEDEQSDEAAYILRLVEAKNNGQETP
jgi:ankyrin repeat protein